MSRVIKRDGSLQDFSVLKIWGSIKRAAAEADLPDLRVRQIVAEVSRGPMELETGGSTVRSRDIREMILGRLDRTAPSVAEAWRAYDIRRR